MKDLFLPTAILHNRRVLVFAPLCLLAASVTSGNEPVEPLSEALRSDPSLELDPPKPGADEPIEPGAAAATEGQDSATDSQEDGPLEIEGLRLLPTEGPAAKPLPWLEGDAARRADFWTGSRLTIASLGTVLLALGLGGLWISLDKRHPGPGLAVAAAGLALGPSTGDYLMVRLGRGLKLTFLRVALLGLGGAALGYAWNETRGKHPHPTPLTWPALIGGIWCVGGAVIVAGTDIAGQPEAQRQRPAWAGGQHVALFSWGEAGRRGLGLRVGF